MINIVKGELVVIPRKMKYKLCIVCGIKYKKQHGNQKYCSLKCVNDAKNSKEYTYRQKICIVCNNKFKVCYPYTGLRCCSEDCSYALERHRRRLMSHTKKYKENVRKYSKTKKYKAARKKYFKTQGYKDCMKRITQSEGFKEYMRKYHKTEPFRLAQKKYKKSKKGKETSRKYYENVWKKKNE